MRGRAWTALGLVSWLALGFFSLAVLSLMSCVPLSKHRRMIAVRDTIVAANLTRARDLETELLGCQKKCSRQAAILQKFNQVNEDGILWKDQTK